MFPFSCFVKPFFSQYMCLLCLHKLLNIVQMILKTAGALVALLLELFGEYGDGEFTWYNG
jgi:hypothetical protein